MLCVVLVGNKHSFIQLHVAALMLLQHRLPASDVRSRAQLHRELSKNWLSSTPR